MTLSPAQLEALARIGEGWTDCQDIEPSIRLNLYWKSLIEFEESGKRWSLGRARLTPAGKAYLKEKG